MWRTQQGSPNVQSTLLHELIHTAMFAEWTHHQITRSETTRVSLDQWRSISEANADLENDCGFLHTLTFKKLNRTVQDLVETCWIKKEHEETSVVWIALQAQETEMDVTDWLQKAIRPKPRPCLNLSKQLKAVTVCTQRESGDWTSRDKQE